MFIVQLTFPTTCDVIQTLLSPCSRESQYKVNSCVNKSPERRSKEMDLTLRSVLISALQSSSQMTTSTTVSTSGSKTACSQIQYPYHKFEIRFFISILCLVRTQFQVQILHKSLIIKQLLIK